MRIQYINESEIRMSLSEDKAKILFLLNNFDLTPVTNNSEVLSFARENRLFKKYKIKECAIEVCKNEVQKYMKDVKEKKGLNVIRRTSSRIVKLKKMKECCIICKRYDNK